MNTNFYKRFWLEISLEEWKEKFINRVNQVIFDDIESRTYNYFINYRWYDSLIEYICWELWLQPSNYYTPRHTYWNNYKGIAYITQNSFEKTIEILELLIEINNWRTNIEELLKEILNKSITREQINLGINLKNWIFYPSWKTELDNDLIEKSIDNIIWFKAEKYYNDALFKYLKWDKKWANIACFETLEKLSQELLWNKQWFKENKKDIQKMFSEKSIFNERWSKIIGNLYDYFCDSRHTRVWVTNSDLDELETEAIIYQTWLIINLIIQKFNNQKLWK